VAPLPLIHALRRLRHYCYLRILLSFICALMRLRHHCCLIFTVASMPLIRVLRRLRHSCRLTSPLSFIRALMRLRHHRCLIFIATHLRSQPLVAFLPSYDTCLVCGVIAVLLPLPFPAFPGPFHSRFIGKLERTSQVPPTQSFFSALNISQILLT
jgi:hypothetical protein